MIYRYLRTNYTQTEVPEAEHESGIRVDCVGGHYAYIESLLASSLFDPASYLWSPPVEPPDGGLLGRGKWGYFPFQGPSITDEFCC